MPRGSSRASSGSVANIPMSIATPPTSATVLANPAAICHTSGRKVFCQRTRPRDEFLLGGVGRLLRQGYAKPKTQIGRSFGRADGTDQCLRIPPLREFIRTTGADFKMRGNLAHGCAAHGAVEVCRELLAKMRALLHLAPLALVASVSIG